MDIRKSLGNRISGEKERREQPYSPNISKALEVKEHRGDRADVTRPSGLLLSVRSQIAEKRLEEGSWKCDSAILLMFLVRYCTIIALLSHPKE